MEIKTEMPWSGQTAAATCAGTQVLLQALAAGLWRCTHSVGNSIEEDKSEAETKKGGLAEVNKTQPKVIKDIRVSCSFSSVIRAILAAIVLAFALDVDIALRAGHEIRKKSTLLGQLGKADLSGLHGVSSSNVGIEEIDSMTRVAVLALEEILRILALLVVEDMVIFWTARWVIAKQEFRDQEVFQGTMGAPSAFTALEFKIDAINRNEIENENAMRVDSGAQNGGDISRALSSKQGSSNKGSKGRKQSKKQKVKEWSYEQVAQQARLMQFILCLASAIFSIVVCLPSPFAVIIWQSLRTLEAIDLIIWESTADQDSGNLGHALWRPSYWIPCIAAKGHRGIYSAFLLPSLATLLGRWTFVGIGVPLPIVQMIFLTLACVNIVDHRRLPQTSMLMASFALLLILAFAPNSRFLHLYSNFLS
mmetsp:Transcript_10668/g.21003  ORF Transcript_10668/g.21003 Transcript_10668/m.21003 type:complete len:421 (+) Transcript_10668:1372-2634(+)